MFGLNVNANAQPKGLPGQVQQFELIEQDRISINDGLLRIVRKKHLGLMAGWLFSSVFGIGVSTFAIWFSVGLAATSMSGFLMVSVGVLAAVLGYIYYFVSKPVFYLVLTAVVCALIIAFDLL